jgi:hypothetical protein
MIYYIYDSKNKIYYTQERVLNDVVPENSTTLKPPIAPEGQVAQFDGQSWNLVIHPDVLAAKEAEEKMIAQVEADKKQEETRSLLNQTNEFGVPLYVLKNGVATQVEAQALADQTKKAAIMQLKQKRNQLLKDTDFAFLSDVPAVYYQKHEELVAYRQALRDLPKNTPDPLNVTWPKNPLE